MMLEEAAGISGLHARRKDAEQKLRAAEANITRLDELLSDQEARAAALSRQARAAERYRLLTDKIRGARSASCCSRAGTRRERAAQAATAEAEGGWSSGFPAAGGDGRGAGAAGGGGGG